MSHIIPALNQRKLKTKVLTQRRRVPLTTLVPKFLLSPTSPTAHHQHLRENTSTEWKVNLRPRHFFPRPTPSLQVPVNKRRATAPMASMEVVKGPDLNRYMGRWYEMASIPSRNQPRDGKDTRATYTLDPDGATVRVLNETWSGGKRGYIEGTAYKVDPASDEAKLKVKFYVPPFLPLIPVVGDYWVLHVDQDYQYALVGQPSRTCLWILCRQRRMDEEVYDMLVQKANEAGYDISKLRKTPHSETPPEGDDGPKDKQGVWWIKSILGK